MTGPLQTTLLLATLIVGTVWSLPLHPGRITDGPAAASVASPSFAISVRRGVVTLAGHTASRHHESQLRQAVAQHFRAREPVFEFRPFGPVPDWWTTATTEMIRVIAPMHAPRVRLDEGTLVLRALATQPTAARDSVIAVARSLPVALEIDVRVLDAGPDAGVRSLCARQFAAFRNGPVNFFESETRMRPSAIPELERVLALAVACRDATISVTGHTDSSGDEAWNRHLSLERARAVSDWLVAHGVAVDRIVLRGAGSSEPIADNETRYGRSLNRRIDIGFAYDD